MPLPTGLTAMNACHAFWLQDRRTRFLPSMPLLSGFATHMDVHLPDGV